MLSEAAKMDVVKWVRKPISGKNRHDGSDGDGLPITDDDSPGIPEQDAERATPLSKPSFDDQSEEYEVVDEHGEVYIGKLSLCKDDEWKIVEKTKQTSRRVRFEEVSSAEEEDRSQNRFAPLLKDQSDISSGWNPQIKVRVETSENRTERVKVDRNCSNEVPESRLKLNAAKRKKSRKMRIRSARPDKCERKVSAEAPVDTPIEPHVDRPYASWDDFYADMRKGEYYRKV